MLDFLLDLVFPRICVGCGRWGKFICERCASGIEYFDFQVCPYCERQSLYGLTHPRCQKSFGIDGMFVAAHYRGLVKKIIHQIKYQGYYSLSGEVAELMVGKYHGKFDFDYFVPVPLSAKRERERGFNQAEKLASNLARIMNDEFRMKRKCKMKNDKCEVKDKRVVLLLARTRETRPQFDLKYEDRKKNMTGAFVLNSQLTTHNLQHYSFCLVDDVATTGATIFEGAKVLKKAGAEKVWAMCLARGG